MVIGVCTMDLQVPGSESLKDKRRVIRSIVSRVRNQFNVSIAEVDHQDSWQLATLAVACVATDQRYTDQRYAEGLLQRTVDFVERCRGDLVLLDYAVEIL